MLNRMPDLSQTRLGEKLSASQQNLQDDGDA
jgi:hypothetical protein